METLTLKEAAGRLKCSTKHLTKLFKRGEIVASAIGLGRHLELRFTPEAIEQFLAARQGKATGQPVKRGRLPSVPTVV